MKWWKLEYVRTGTQGQVWKTCCRPLQKSFFRHVWLKFTKYIHFRKFFRTPFPTHILQWQHAIQPMSLKNLAYFSKHSRRKCPFSSAKKWHLERPNLRTDSRNLAKHPPKWWGVEFWFMRFHLRASIKQIFEHHGFRGVLEPFYPTQFSSKWSNFLGEVLDIIVTEHTKRGTWSERLCVFWNTLLLALIGVCGGSPQATLTQIDFGQVTAKLVWCRIAVPFTSGTMIKCMTFDWFQMIWDLRWHLKSLQYVRNVEAQQVFCAQLATCAPVLTASRSSTRYQSTI